MRRRYSLGRSILVWIIGALIGWIVAFGGIYYAIRTGDNLFADLFGQDRTETVPAVETTEMNATESPISPEELRELQQIAPAAGPSETNAPAQTDDY